MKLLSKLIFLIVLTTTTSACTYNNGHYAAISDRPITLYTLTSPKKWKVATGVEAQSTNHAWLFLTLDDVPTIEYSVGKILDENMGDYLANVDVTYKAFHLMWLYHYTSWQIKGDVIRSYQ